MKILNWGLSALAILLLTGCAQNGAGGQSPNKASSMTSAKAKPAPTIKPAASLIRSHQGTAKLAFTLTDNAKFTLTDRDAGDKVLVKGTGTGKQQTISGGITSGVLTLTATKNGKQAQQTLTVINGDETPARVLPANAMGLGPSDAYGLRVTKLTTALNAQGQVLVAKGTLRKNLTVQVTVEYANYSLTAGFLPTPSQFTLTGPFLAPATVATAQQGTTKIEPGGFATTTFWAVFGNAGEVLGPGLQIQLDYKGPSGGDPLSFQVTTS